MNNDKPSFLSNPVHIRRLYHGLLVDMWEGEVQLTDIEGWAKNPRISQEMQEWENRFDGPITQKQLYQRMQEIEDVDLKRLSKDISKNGLREPIVLTFDKRLLDGNRRFFASKMAYEQTDDATKKRGLETIRAFVLTKNAPEKEERHILVEENFSPSLKREWPDYVKARYIVEAFESHQNESDKSNAEIIKSVAKEFGWDNRKVQDTLRTWEMINEFIKYAVTESVPESDQEGLGKEDLEAEKVASDSYQYFNEAQKSFRNPLLENSVFAALFYDLIDQGDFFKSFVDVRFAYKGYLDEDCRAIMESKRPGGGRDVRLHIQMAERQAKKIKGVQPTIEDFIDFLNKLSTAEKKAISNDTLGRLQEALSLVEGMINVAQSDK